ncbi:hypothetical protein SeLEV6574_g07655 [Synchytrium endobioticum]|nr:hypothetical protein SeLEV6574_g07655 [Synchytrium endobioticum]
MELFCYPPCKEWDLPTRDPFCLTVQAYLSLAGAEWTLHETTDTGVSKTGELPMLRDGADSIAGAANIITYLKRKGLDLDAHLTPIQKAECLAYTSLVEEKMYDAWLYTRWIESAKQAQAEQSAVYNYIPLKPIVNVFTVSDEAKARARLSSYRNADEVYQAVNDAYHSILVKLGSKEYIFGNLATSLDAYLFAHLSFHTLHSLSSPRLFTALEFQYPALLRYISRLGLVAVKPPTHISPQPPIFTAIKAYVISVPERVSTSIRRRFHIQGDREAVTKYIVDAAYVLGAVGALFLFNWHYNIVHIVSSIEDTREDEGLELDGLDEDD